MADKRKMKVSVIISVYNHFEWLRLILDALGMQSVSDFEVVIADDGSSAEMIDAIACYSENHSNLKIIHVWHEDKGWRKNAALNAAVRASSGDYLIFVDGDCIPHTEFVSDHIDLAMKGRVIAGRRVDLPAKVSAEIENINELPKNYVSIITRRILQGLFRSFGESAGVLKRLVRFSVRNGSVIGMKRGGILGCNFSIYRTDFEKVNGFDERYVHPGVGEDTDLDLRLSNAGIYGWKVSRAALMYHRHHKRLPMDSEENQKILKENREKHAAWVTTGLVRDIPS